MRAPAIIVEAVGFRFEGEVVVKRSLRLRVICSSTLRKGRYRFVCPGVFASPAVALLPSAPPPAPPSPISVSPSLS